MQTMSVIHRPPSMAWAEGVPEGPGATAAELAATVRDRRWLVLSGAGISTASGIPDYRGPDGTRRVQPMTIQDFRSSDEARRRYWARSYVGWQRLSSARPNPGHAAVADLQGLQVVDRIITQNVDGLHQRAGADRVVELHGSLAQVICELCGDGTTRPELDAAMALANPDFTATSDEIRPDGDIALLDVDVARFRAPHCRSCDSDRLRPDVVFFGDSVPKDRVTLCHRLVSDSEGVLVLGSSLAVMSGLRFVRQAVRENLPVVIVTVGPSRADELATVRSHRQLEDVLPDLVAELRR